MNNSHLLINCKCISRMSERSNVNPHTLAMSHAVVNADREELVTCPYDPVHMISQMRLPYHLIKCRKNHNGKAYQQCPYDGKHVILRSKFQDHMNECDKRAIVEPQLVLEDSRTIEVPESQAQAIQQTLSNEWDLDVPSAATTNMRVTETLHNTFLVDSNNSQPRFPTDYKEQEFNSFNSPAGSNFDSPKTSNFNSPEASKFNSTEISQDSQSAPSAPSIPRRPNPQKKKFASKLEDVNQKQNVVKQDISYDNYGYNLQKSGKSSYGRGRAAASTGAQEFSVMNSQVGPSSYQIQNTAESYTESYTEGYTPLSLADTPPPPVSFGRGRGAPRFLEQPARRPGFTDKESLEKDKLKLLKKIRECKALEERLQSGEVLQENQVICNLLAEKAIDWIFLYKLHFSYK